MKTTYIRKIHFKDEVEYSYDGHSTTSGGPFLFWDGKKKISVSKKIIMDRYPDIYLPSGVKRLISDYLNGSVDHKVIHHG